MTFARETLFNPDQPFGLVVLRLVSTFCYMCLMITEKSLSWMNLVMSVFGWHRIYFSVALTNLVSKAFSSKTLLQSHIIFPRCISRSI